MDIIKTIKWIEKCKKVVKENPPRLTNNRVREGVGHHVLPPRTQIY